MTAILEQPAAAGPTHTANDTIAGIPMDRPDLFVWLEAASEADLDGLSFGLVAMSADSTVEHYNPAEARISGLTPERVIGRNFFTSVAPCTNNFMVAHRFETEAVLDATVEYVFTFMLAPRRVTLRLLKQPGGRRMYLAVQPRD
jgi:photoactive yellow protein